MLARIIVISNDDDGSGSENNSDSMVMISYQLVTDEELFSGDRGSQSRGGRDSCRPRFPKTHQHYHQYSIVVVVVMKSNN